MGTTEVSSDDETRTGAADAGDERRHRTTVIVSLVALGVSVVVSLASIVSSFILAGTQNAIAFDALGVSCAEADAVAKGDYVVLEHAVAGVGADATVDATTVGRFITDAEIAAARCDAAELTTEGRGDEFDDALHALDVAIAAGHVGQQRAVSAMGARLDAYLPIDISTISDTFAVAADGKMISGPATSSSPPASGP